MFHKIAIFVSLLALTGCNSAMDVEVRGLTSTNIDPYNTFTIKHQDQFKIETDAEYIEVREQLSRALMMQGLNEVNSISNSDIVIFIDYGVTQEIEDRGSYNKDRERTWYKRFLNLSAVNGKKFSNIGEKEVLWTNEIESISLVENFPRVMPLLIAAAMDYFGKKTDNPVKVSISENDSRGIKIRDGM